MRYSAEGSFTVSCVNNGYVVEVNGTMEDQQDCIGKTYAFENIDNLILWLKKKEVSNH